ncbi:Hemicentin-1 [Eumeta japonica]|uniref:Hemicentin-1 n=1 Tax=Eumeta variegata TaxID=151549 RepID=A0A4C1UKZ6_EUMVA|nr:Hemicentin-1 [Eumeta japonica]
MAQRKINDFIEVDRLIRLKRQEIEEFVGQTEARPPRVSHRRRVVASSHLPTNNNVVNDVKVAKDNVARVRWYKGDHLLGDSGETRRLLPERMKMWSNYSLQIDSLQANDTANYTCECVESLFAEEVKLRNVKIGRGRNCIFRRTSQLRDEIYRLTLFLSPTLYLCVSFFLSPSCVGILDATRCQRSRWPVTAKSTTGGLTCSEARSECCELLKLGIKQLAQSAVVRTAPWGPIKQTHSIEVQFPPTVRTIPEDGYIEVRKGQLVDIGCDVTGVPVPLVDWRKNGEPIALLEHRQRIRFTAEHRHLAGTYECVAGNGVGDLVKASIQVLIQDAPVVYAEKSFVHTAIGLRASLSAILEFSIPPARTTWYREGRPVRTGDRIKMIVQDKIHQLIFRHVQRGDFGNYTFRAENKLGMADVSFRLTGVPNVASFKVDHNVNRPSATSFTLVWEVDSYAPVIEQKLTIGTLRWGRWSERAPGSALVSSRPSEPLNDNFTVAPSQSVRTVARGVVTLATPSHLEIRGAPVGCSDNITSRY